MTLSAIYLRANRNMSNEIINDFNNGDCEFLCIFILCSFSVLVLMYFKFCAEALFNYPFRRYNNI